MKSYKILFLLVLLAIGWNPSFSQGNGGRSLKRKVAIARFTNESTYAKGIFYNKESNNPIEKQASDMLATKLAATEKFILIERQDFDQIAKEGQIGDVSFQKVGADFLILGSVTEFGRTTTGESKFGKQIKNETSQTTETKIS
jgi:curli biogenesis system outer membrane secretion channel CsgG